MSIIVKFGASALVCLGGLVSLAMTNLVSSDTPGSSVVIEAANRLGIKGETLAGLGISGQRVSDVLDELADRFDDASAVFAHDVDLAGVTMQMNDAARRLRLDRADEEAQTALTTAQSQAASIETSRNQAKESLLLSIFSGLAEPDAVRRVLLDQYGADRLPIAYRFAPTSEDEAARLAWALDTTRLASARNEDPPSAASALVSAAHGNVAVQAALVNVATHTEANRLEIDRWAAKR